MDLLKKETQSRVKGNSNINECKGIVFKNSKYTPQRFVKCFKKNYIDGYDLMNNQNPIKMGDEGECVFAIILTLKGDIVGEGATFVIH